MSSTRSAHTSGSSCSTRSCRARYGWRRRPATVSRSIATTPGRPVRTRITGSRWRWSSVADNPPRRGLGRGLAALVAEFPSGQVSLIDLELSQIRPNPKQPRRDFDEEAIGRLAESITAEGVVQPILVREADQGYEIVAGERRW